MGLNKYNPEGFALSIFKDRYAIHENETFDEACQRVSRHIADAETGSKREEYFKKFYEILVSNRFCPGGRIWRGSGRPRGQLLNCFVINDDIDSREGWGETLKDVVIISGTGGGCGICFSKVRPRGTQIRGTGGESTGAVSLMKMINAVANELREGGGRRVALMNCLHYSHPDLPEFLKVKLDDKELNNANISVIIDDKFISLLENDEEVVFKWQEKEYGRMKAKDIWNKILENAWKSGDPGILNGGFANEQNNIYYIGELISTNPCGEIWLRPFDCCDLGAIVLSSHIKENNEIDWDMLDDTIRQGVRFLDNVLDVNEYPLPVIKDTCHKIRRIGLGVMGLHDLLLKMNIKYSSQEAFDLVDKIMSFIKKKAYEASIFIAAEKGSFPALDREKFVASGFCKNNLTPSLRRKILEYGIRNCAVLTIAPTGTTSIVAGVSSGIEPIYCLIYQRNFNKHKDQHDDKMKLGTKEIVIHPLFKEFLEAGRSVEHFESALDIHPSAHIKMQVICQKHVDNAISKTINLPENFTLEDLSGIVLENIRHLKGVTIYRDGSKGKSPLMPLPKEEAKQYIKDNVCISESTVNDCPLGKCEIGG